LRATYADIAVAARSPDFARTASDYARYRAGFPADLLDRLLARGIVRAGARVLDLGTGTGSLARLFARYGCMVTGVDIATPLLAQAQRLDSEIGVKIEYVEARAEATGLPDGAFDVVSAGQCWHWFDRPAVAREVKRLLSHDGSVVIAHFDWLALPGNVVEATQEVILRYTPLDDPSHGPWRFAHGTGVYPSWLTDLQTAGFAGIETFSFDVQVPYSRRHPGGRGSRGLLAGAGRDADRAVPRRPAYHPTPCVGPHGAGALVMSDPKEGSSSRVRCTGPLNDPRAGSASPRCRCGRLLAPPRPVPARTLRPCASAR
jgi:SAM-dependent methyltransferase